VALGGENERGLAAVNPVAGAVEEEVEVLEGLRQEVGRHRVEDL
jgi:hypothetical protein